MCGFSAAVYLRGVRGICKRGGMRTSPDRWVRIWADMYVEMAGLCLSFCYAKTFLSLGCMYMFNYINLTDASVNKYLDGGGLERD